jgi:hypothetical protein
MDERNQSVQESQERSLNPRDQLTVRDPKRPERSSQESLETNEHQESTERSRDQQIPKICCDRDRTATSANEHQENLSEGV